MANQHVVPNNGQWQVKRENADRATKTFNTQKEAIEYGKDIAMRQQSELIIHDCPASNYSSHLPQPYGRLLSTHPFPCLS